MILLPKNDVARTMDAFRPISVQKCPLKAIALLITNSQKPLMSLLIHANQTGFINGVNIDENIIYRRPSQLLPLAENYNYGPKTRL